MYYTYKGTNINNLIASGGSTSTGYSSPFPTRSSSQNTNAMTKVDATFGYTGDDWDHTYFSANISHITTTSYFNIDNQYNHFRAQTVGGGGGGGGGGAAWYSLKDEQHFVRGTPPGSSGNPGEVNDDTTKRSVGDRYFRVRIGNGGAGGTIPSTQGVNRNNAPQNHSSPSGNVGDSGGTTSLYYSTPGGHALTTIMYSLGGAGGAGGAGAHHSPSQYGGYEFGDSGTYNTPGGSVPWARETPATSYAHSSYYGIGNYGAGGAGGRGATGKIGQTGPVTNGNDGSAGNNGHVRIFTLHG